MEVLIFSDSHGKISPMLQAVARQPKAPSRIFYLGDGLRDLESVNWEGYLVSAVKGNCDFFGSVDYPEELLLSLEGHTLLLTHGARYNVKYGLEALKTASAEKGADLVLFGHTHRAYYEILPEGTTVGNKRLERPMHLFNPGSVGDGSFGTLLLTEDTVLFSHGRQ